MLTGDVAVAATPFSMAGSPVSLDYWRKFFRSANGDILEVMEQAVVVAATDYPDEFRSRRAQLAEKLFTALLPRCFGCVGAADGEEGDGSVKRDDVVKRSNDDYGPEDLNGIVSNYSYDEAEALTEEIEEANEVVTEVSRIKQILVNYQDEVCVIVFLQKLHSWDAFDTARTLFDTLLC